MKSEFVLAFNEICEVRGLPKEDVFDALKTALVSAFRRDLNLSSIQDVQVEIDPRTGESTIFAEKEVVEYIVDNRTEVVLSEAKSKGFPDAQIGDIILIDSTTPLFGRIAAQTAKQVLLQRVREAEREHLYEDFSGREGELVNGTVQSISGQHITIGLGRTEAILPKGQQVPGERYRAHDKIRVYVLEVRRTNRGPQIFVSRNHRNLLRRLLELEVPEIYNGQVEIKSIAREAGQRSKVAVLALQPGVDPVGACVGMRGVRIQSIVRELNDEKIDVIEWDSDQQTFIAKALSPARVAHVFLEEDPDDGKTAIVVVPDDQLSLAIGREGQNARLAAKLTGWRIDIKSLTEAAAESLTLLDHPNADTAVAQNEELVEQVKHIIQKKAENRPVTSEDYRTLDRLVSGVLGAIIATRAIRHEAVRKERAQARKQVPNQLWQAPLDELDLPGRIHNLLLDNEVETVGDVIFNLELGDDVILNFRGLGEAALVTIKEAVAAFEKKRQAEAPPETEAAEDEEALAVAVEDEVEETAVAPDALIDEAEETEAVVKTDATEEEAAEESIDVDIIDDLSRSLIQEAPKPAPQKKKKGVVIARPTAAEQRQAEEEAEKSNKSRSRELVFDEEIGEVVAKRKRKGSRRRQEWDEFDLDDF